LLYALYLGLAAYGYWEWRRDMRGIVEAGKDVVPLTPSLSREVEDIDYEEVS
jgi:hypothetical protein